ncbi:MAG: hypothetical protein ACRYFS_12260 [Janthinobacterium lividum]
MLRSKKVWVPCLLALLSLLGTVLAATDTGIGPNNMYVRGQLAPWFWGALVAVMALFTFLASLWRWYLPDWERPYALLRTEEVVDGRRVPVLMFPYSNAPEVFIAMVSLLIIGTSFIGSLFFLFALALPFLALTIRAVFGRQFVGLTPEGLVWRIMPAGSSRGGSDLRGNEMFRRQPVQFLPWSAISGVTMAEVVPSDLNGDPVSRPASTSLMLRVSVSDQAALAGLTHYQRIVPSETGTAVLIPLRQTGSKKQHPLLKAEQIRAEPEAVWEAIDYYTNHPEERGQIGSALGNVSRRVTESVPGIDTAELPGRTPVMQVVAETSGQDALDAAQRVGGRASKAGKIVNAILGMPYFLIALVLLFSGHLSNHDRRFFPVTFAYLLLIVLPATVAFSSMLAAFAAPPGQERAYARVSQQEAVISVIMLSVLTLSLSAYQYFDPGNPGTTQISVPVTLAAIVLTLAGLFLSSLAGVRIAQAAKTSGPAWLTDVLSLWVKRLL